MAEFATTHSGLGDLGERVKAWTEAFYANSADPMLNFDEADLERFFTEAGFADVVLELDTSEYEVEGERFLTQVGAPGRATMLQRWAADFAQDEVERLADFVRARRIRLVNTQAFLTASKR